jgi:hypothetical protein
MSEPSLHEPTESNQSKRVEQENANITYMATAKESEVDTSFQDVRTLLDDIVMDNQRISTNESPDDSMDLGGRLTLNVAAIKKLQSDPRIRYVKDEPEKIEDYVNIHKKEEEEQE